MSHGFLREGVPLGTRRVVPLEGLVLGSPRVSPGCPQMCPGAFSHGRPLWDPGYLA